MTNRHPLTPLIPLCVHPENNEVIFIEGVSHRALHCFQNADDDVLSWLLKKNSWRLSKAEEILKNLGYSVTEVANMPDCPTIQIFNLAFLKK